MEELQGLPGALNASVQDETRVQDETTQAFRAK